MVFASATRAAALLSLAAPGVLGAFHQHLAAPPAGWVKADFKVNVATKTKTSFTLALAMQNLDQLEATLLSVSTPGSSEYGKFKDQDELQSTFSASTEAVDSVTTWLKANGISEYRVDGAFIDFVTDVATANQAFNASYEHYTSGDVTKLRTLSYSIPDEIQEHIVFLDPSIYFGKTTANLPKMYPPIQEARSAPAQRKPRAGADAVCDTITPSCLKELYNIGDYTPDVASDSRIGFGSFLNQSALQSDVAAFEDLFGIPRQSISKVLLEGGVDDEDGANRNYGEADLDAETIIGIANPLPVTEFITGGSPPWIPDLDTPENTNEPYVPFFRYLLSKPNSEIPQVISISYGDIEHTVPYDYAVLTCSLIALQGLRGITIISSSGDIGVGAGCLSADNTTVEFNPTFPASCPYITTIGGTNDVPETVWPGSSGGFSNYFPRPLYQQLAVSNYLKQVDKDTIAYYSKYTNFNGRGFPDVSALSGEPWFRVIYNGRQSLSGGTSASAPVWAAVVGLLNDARLRAGKSTLGWLNPLLYAFGPKVLNDITEGQSIGCNGVNYQSGQPEPDNAGIVPWAFWNATQGWDPATGYGTPDFGKLKDLVLSF